MAASDVKLYFEENTNGEGGDIKMLSSDEHTSAPQSGDNTRHVKEDVVCAPLIYHLSPSYGSVESCKVQPRFLACTGLWTIGGGVSCHCCNPGTSARTCVKFSLCGIFNRAASLGFQVEEGRKASGMTMTAPTDML